jgi:hypothetical protein
MKLTDDWFTSIALDDENRTVYVNGRLNLTDFIAGGKYKYRIEIQYLFEGGSFPQGMDAQYIEAVEDLLRPAMEKDKMAILTGNYLASGCKYWVYYSRTDQVFFDRLNFTLKSLPLLPLKFVLEIDPEWSEYYGILGLWNGVEED